MLGRVFSNRLLHSTDFSIHDDQTKSNLFPKIRSKIKSSFFDQPTLRSRSDSYQLGEALLKKQDSCQPLYSLFLFSVFAGRFTACLRFQTKNVQQPIFQFGSETQGLPQNRIARVFRPLVGVTPSSFRRFSARAKAADHATPKPFIILCSEETRQCARPQRPSPVARE